MTPTFIQGNSLFSSSGYTTSWNVAFSSNVASGNMLVVAVFGITTGTSGSFSVSDSLGNTYSTAIANSGVLSTNNFADGIYYAAAGSSGANTLTINYSGTGANYFRLMVHEYSNVVGLDQTTSGSGSGTNLSAGSVTTTYANEVIFGLQISNAGINSAGSGFTQRAVAGSEITEDMIVSSTGTYPITANGNTYDDWTALGVTFYNTSSGGGPTSPGPGGLATDTPEAHGAVRDGVTDDTAAIQAAIDGVYATGIANGSYYGEVIFTPGVYLVFGALVQGSATDGNAQITLPIHATTDVKFTLSLRGPASSGSSLPHWGQTSAQQGGAVIKSTLTGQSYSSTHGLPSVIGGPTPEHGYATTGALFDNIRVVIDGLEVVAPANPSLCGVDLRGIGECNIIDLGVQADQIPGSAAVPTNIVTGLMMPYNANNDYCEIGQYSCEGFYRGILLGEHTNAKAIRTIYCYTGVAIGGPNPHSIFCDYISTEWCYRQIEFVNIGTVAYGSAGAFITISQLDIETGSGVWAPGDAIYDPGNALYGDLTYSPNGGTATVTLNGAENLHIKRLDVPAGAHSTPTVPGSGSALTNAIGRDAAVTVTGGSVSNIEVDGVALNVTSGTVIVPSFKTVKLTYSSAPNWVWTVL